jgi:uncharacterized protein (DUF934 family)
MDMERVMEFLLVSEENMDTNHKKMLAKMASLQEKRNMRNTELDAHHEKMTTSQEQTIAKMDAWLGELKDSRKETAACQEAMKANSEKMEANPDEMKSVTVHFPNFSVL